MITAKQLADALKHSLHKEVDGVRGRYGIEISVGKMRVDGMLDLESVADELNKVTGDKEVDTA